MFRAIDIAMVLAVSLLPWADAAIDEQPVSFRKDVANILLENCVACHGPKKAEGGYRIDTFEALQKPGDTGALPIASDPEASSELLRRITSVDVAERMPADAEPLIPAQIATVKRWLSEGAKFDGDNPGMPLSRVIPPKAYADPPPTYPMPIPISAMAFSPDGSLLLVGGYHEITVWLTADGTLSKRIKNIGERVQAIVYLSDQKTIAVACGEPGRNGEVRLVDVESGQVKGVVGRTSDLVFDIAVRPRPQVAQSEKPIVQTADEIAIASADGIIRIVNTETLAETKAIANHSDWVTAVAWSDDGGRLASASRDKSAKVFDAMSGELLASYLGHAAAVRGIAFLPDGKQLVTTGTDKKMHRWELEGAKKVTEIPTGGEATKMVRGDQFVLVPSADRLLRLVHFSDNRVAFALGGYQDWVVSTAYHAGTNRAAGGALNGEVRLWNATDGTLVRNWIAKP